MTILERYWNQEDVGDFIKYFTKSIRAKIEKYTEKTFSRREISSEFFTAKATERILKACRDTLVFRKNLQVLTIDNLSSR